MDERAAIDRLFEELGLGEYERTALEALLTHGRTTAPNLVEATGVPQARIYGILENLGNRGFIEIIPGRPKEYQPKAPEAILERAIENQRQDFEDFQATIDEVSDAFRSAFESQYHDANEDITPAEELFHVVDVGEPSEAETRTIYRHADDQINVLTKSLEYLDAIEPALRDALDRGVDVQMLFLHPQHLSAANATTQREIRDRMAETFPAVELRFSERPLPWRGTLADPSMEYDSGVAILLVEETDVPLHMRQAAVTENGSFVAGLRRYFELIWEYESVVEPEPTE